MPPNPKSPRSSGARSSTSRASGSGAAKPTRSASAKGSAAKPAAARPAAKSAGKAPTSASAAKSAGKAPAKATTAKPAAKTTTKAAGTTSRGASSSSAASKSTKAPKSYKGQPGELEGNRPALALIVGRGIVKEEFYKRFRNGTTRKKAAKDDTGLELSPEDLAVIAALDWTSIDQNVAELRLLLPKLKVKKDAASW